MTDSALQYFLAYGTSAQRLAFTPSVPSHAAAPYQLYCWWETDTSKLYVYAGGAWSLVNSGGGGGANTITATVATGVTLVAGNLVHFGASGLVLADSTDDTKPADGFVLAGYAAGASATVYLPGSPMAGLTVTQGSLYYLSTAGGITTTVPTSGAKQIIGRAYSTTGLVFNPGPVILL